VPVETRDEIGRLAAAFNRMADAVARRTTDLATAAEEARAERARLSAVIAAMQDALVVSDATGKPVIANAAAAPLLGPAPDAVAPPDGLVPRGERLFEVRSAPLPGPHGEAAGRLVVARDVTERVAEDERRLHHDRLAVLGEAAAVMAHELNNPLAAMLMFNGMLEDELPPASPLREYAAVIRRNGESCKRSIRSLLDYATEAAAEATTLDLAAVLADVLRFLRPLAERSRFTFSLRVEAAETSLVGDETRLRQVFVNLLVNAVQAAGAEPGSAEIVVRAADDGLLVDVADDGPGIPQAARDAIFRPFFTTKPRGQGTGLGLPTALRIAELHGGGIELLPKGPPGATFRVRLARRYAGTA
jgi:signal transduction histidine kinase